MLGFWVSASLAAVPDKSKAAVPGTKATKPVPTKPPESPVVPSELSADHLVVAEKVILGTVSCELGSKVHVKADKHPGRFIVELGREKFRMEPALTTTGAVRLEAPSTGAVWLQLGNKSMLLHTRLGKRLADSCVNEHQSVVASAMEKSKPANLLEDEAPSNPGK
ncbi:MAG: hypothetical protein CFE44_20395 [Burkholderiales bacterium PBB4]|nr:MAG: hypothetical protein CFE44_20395 [Burkholderiales bacterium PBB4]